LSRKLRQHLLARDAQRRKERHQRAARLAVAEQSQFDAAFDYIRQHTEVRDVSLSGGDPLMLSDRRVEYLLAKLRAIPHVEIVRIHTRIPSQLPERITPELCETIKVSPVFVNVHFNHRTG
jgi:lysine 2,3-aminomutase